MREAFKVAVIIPALNEEQAIAQVISSIPPWVDDIIVVDNGSRDRTGKIARSKGARVVLEPRRGYGTACLTGIAALKEGVDIVVFLDGDYSDFPEEMDRVVDPIITGQADLVIGSRILGSREKGALTPQARFGNWLSCLIMGMVMWRNF